MLRLMVQAAAEGHKWAPVVLIHQEVRAMLMTVAQPAA